MGSCQILRRLVSLRGTEFTTFVHNYGSLLRVEKYLLYNEADYDENCCGVSLDDIWNVLSRLIELSQKETFPPQTRYMLVYVLRNVPCTVSAFLKHRKEVDLQKWYQTIWNALQSVGTFGIDEHLFPPLYNLLTLLIIRNANVPVYGKKTFVRTYGGAFCISLLNAGVSCDYMLPEKGVSFKELYEPFKAFWDCVRECKANCSKPDALVPAINSFWTYTNGIDMKDTCGNDDRCKNTYTFYKSMKASGSDLLQFVKSYKPDRRAKFSFEDIYRLEPFQSVKRVKVYYVDPYGIKQKVCTFTVKPSKEVESAFALYYCVTGEQYPGVKNNYVSSLGCSDCKCVISKVCKDDKLLHTFYNWLQNESFAEKVKRVCKSDETRREEIGEIILSLLERNYKLGDAELLLQCDGEKLTANKAVQAIAKSSNDPLKVLEAVLDAVFLRGNIFI